jgi:hypothetical protein
MYPDENVSGDIGLPPARWGNSDDQELLPSSRRCRTVTSLMLLGCISYVSGFTKG